MRKITIKNLHKIVNLKFGFDSGKLIRTISKAEGGTDSVGYDYYSFWIASLVSKSHKWYDETEIRLYRDMDKSGRYQMFVFGLDVITSLYLTETDMDSPAEILMWIKKCTGLGKEWFDENYGSN